MGVGSKGHGPEGQAAGRTRPPHGDHQPATDPSQAGITDAAVRRRAALQAGYGGDGAAAAAMLADPDPDVRATAVGALVRASGLVPVVLDAARADAAAAVRRRACEEIGRALGRLVADHADDPAGDDADGHADDDGTREALAVLRQALGDPDPSVVEAAAWATGEAGPRAAGSVADLCGVARRHPAAPCRETAVAALGAIGDEGGLDTVLAALDGRPALRRRAAVALAAFADPRAEDGLRRCLVDRDWQVRQVAEELLRQD